MKTQSLIWILAVVPCLWLACLLIERLQKAYYACALKKALAQYHDYLLVAKETLGHILQSCNHLAAISESAVELDCAYRKHEGLMTRIEACYKSKDFVKMTGGLEQLKKMFPDLKKRTEAFRELALRP